MTKQHLLIFSMAMLLFVHAATAQQSWTLAQCIDYALEHNFSVQKKLLEIETNDIQLNSSKNNRLPSVSAYVNQNFEFGRSESANNLIVDNTQASTSMGIGLDLPIFSGFKTNRQIESDKLNLAASLKDYEQAKEDLELNVTAYFLEVLLRKSMWEISEEQAAFSARQLTQTEQLVAEGRNSDADLYQAQATLASDRLAAVKSANDYRLAKLNLSQLMNVEYSDTFEVEAPTDEQAARLMAQELNLQATIDRCFEHRPALQAAELRIQKSQRDIKVQQAGWYPTLSLSASWGTGYYYAFKSAYVVENKSFGDQFLNNSREMIGLSLRIPIFDRLATRNQVKHSKIVLQNQEIALEECKTSLINEIYQAYHNAVAAKNQYQSAQVAVASAQKSLEYEQVKFDAGKTTAYAYNEAKNKYFKAQADEIQAKFQYILRFRVMEFYGK